MDRPTNQGSREALAGRIAAVQRRIAAAAGRSGRPAAAVELLAVVKQQDDATVAAALELGLRQLAENRVQPLLARPPELLAQGRWHLIGPLQSNKVKAAMRAAAEFHALDRAALVPLLAEALAPTGQRLPVWLQVNIAGEAQKHGCAPSGAAALAAAIVATPALELRGLMALAPYSESPEAARPWFAALRELSLELRRGGALPDRSSGLSMGMSGDFEVAIEEGATLVRVGSALFRDDDAC